jgi:hypothetical protein
VVANSWTTTTNPATARSGLSVYSTAEVTSNITVSATSTGAAATNYANQIGQNTTNYANAVGAATTNYVNTQISSAITNYNVVAGSNATVIPSVSGMTKTFTVSAGSSSFTRADAIDAVRTNANVFTQSLSLSSNLAVNGSTITLVDGTLTFTNGAFTIFNSATDGKIEVSNGKITALDSYFNGDGSGITNIPASAIISNGTYLVNGVIATNSGSAGFLTETGGRRKYSLDGSALTNLIATNLISGTIPAARYGFVPATNGAAIPESQVTGLVSDLAGKQPTLGFSPATNGGSIAYSQLPYTPLAASSNAVGVTGTLTNNTSGLHTGPVQGTLTNSTTGNATTATLSSFVSGTLTNSITGNATTATTSTTATNAAAGGNILTNYSSPTLNSLTVTNSTTFNGTVLFTNTVTVSSGASIFISNHVYDVSGTQLNPGANELVTSAYVNSILNNGVFLYTTLQPTNTSAITNYSGAGGSTTSYVFSVSIPTNYSKTFTFVSTNVNQYFDTLITTNRYLSVSGPFVNGLYLNFSGNQGQNSAAIQIHPEVYASYDLTNLIQLATASPAVLNNNSTTNLYSWTQPAQLYLATNTTGFYLIRRLKCDALTIYGTPTLVIAGGTNYPSALSFTTPLVVSANYAGNFSGVFTGDGTALTNVTATNIVGTLTNNTSGLHTGPVQGTLTNNTSGLHTGPVQGTLTNSTSGNASTATLATNSPYGAFGNISASNATAFVTTAQGTAISNGAVAAAYSYDQVQTGLVQTAYIAADTVVSNGVSARLLATNSALTAAIAAAGLTRAQAQEAVQTNNNSFTGTAGFYGTRTDWRSYSGGGYAAYSIADNLNSQGRIRLFDGETGGGSGYYTATLLPESLRFVNNGTTTVNLDGTNGNATLTGTLTAGYLSGNSDGLTNSYTEGGGIFTGTGVGNWRAAVFAAEEAEAGNGYVAGYGSFSGGSFAASSNSFVSSVAGSFSGGNLSSAINSYIQSSSGSHSGGYLPAATNSYIYSASGSHSGGNLYSTKNSYVSSDNGSFSGGQFSNAKQCSAGSDDGAHSGGLFSESTNAHVFADSGSVAGGNFYGATNVSLTVNTGFGNINASARTNIVITLDNSVVVGTPTNNFTRAFDHEIAVIRADGGVSVALTGSTARDGSLATNIAPTAIVSNGTYLVNGIIATNSGSAGFLTESGGSRKYSLDGGPLTNVNAAYVSGTLTNSTTGNASTATTLVGGGYYPIFTNLTVSPSGGSNSLIYSAGANGQGTMRESFSILQFSNAQNSVTSDPHPDHQTTIGYNLSGSGAQINTNQPAFGLSYEDNWANYANYIQSEWYMSYTTPYSNYNFRPFGINFSRSTNQIPSSIYSNFNANANFDLDALQFYNKDYQAGGLQMTFDPELTGNPRVTMNVYGDINLKTNNSTDGMLNVSGGMVVWRNKANTKTTAITLESAQGVDANTLTFANNIGVDTYSPQILFNRLHGVQVAQQSNNVTALIVQGYTAPATNLMEFWNYNSGNYVSHAAGVPSGVDSNFNFFALAHEIRSNNVAPIVAVDGASALWTDGTNVNVVNRNYGVNTTNRLMRTNDIPASVPSTNITSGTVVWVGGSNAISLNNSYQLFVTSTNVSITNVSGLVSGEMRWTTLVLSNSASTPITNYVSAPCRAIGASTTNSLAIPAAKVGIFSFLGGNNITNFSTVVQQ